MTPHANKPRDRLENPPRKAAKVTTIDLSTERPMSDPSGRGQRPLGGASAGGCDRSAHRHPCPPARLLENNQNPSTKVGLLIPDITITPSEDTHATNASTAHSRTELSAVAAARAELARRGRDTAAEEFAIQATGASVESIEVR